MEISSNKKLSISIPNYNRIEKLKLLVKEVLLQIRKYSLQKEVQLCISDDYSEEDPTAFIQEVIQDNKDIDIRYSRKGHNQGMDMNFLDCVLLSDAEYSWIIGNDDIPTSDGIMSVITILEQYNDLDFLVTPFDILDENGTYIHTLFPLESEVMQHFDTNSLVDRSALISSIRHNSGIFGFLSNVVFRRQSWEEKKTKYIDKNGTLFMQMYLNIDTLLEGAKYCFTNVKIVNNYIDREIEKSMDRLCRIILGLDGVVETFFCDDEKILLKRNIVDSYISGKVWEASQKEQGFAGIGEMDSEKLQMYRKYYISPATLKKIWSNSEIVLYGAGNYGSQAYSLLCENDILVSQIADSDLMKVGNIFCEHRIQHIDQVVSEDVNKCFIVANNVHLCQMIKYLLGKGVSNICIII